MQIIQPGEGNVTVPQDQQAYRFLMTDTLKHWRFNLTASKRALAGIYIIFQAVEQMKSQGLLTVCSTLPHYNFASMLSFTVFEHIHPVEHLE